METAPITGDDISARIQLAQRLLKRENDRLEELKDLVTATQENIVHLERMLLEYRAAVAPSPIRRCPPEVLGMIFRFLTVDFENLNAISLVCKQWHDLVLQEPQLWSTIQVKLPDKEWNMRSWSRSSRSYIRKHLERSRSSRVKVELEFSSLRMITGQLIEMLSNGVRDITRYALSDADQSTIMDWLCDLYYGDLEDGLEIVSNWDPYYVIDLVEEFIDPDGQFMGRLDNLSIHFPRNTVAISLWEKLAAHTGNFSYFSLVGLDYDILDEFYAGDPPIWELPNVKTLCVFGLPNWPHFLSLNPASLQKLSIDMSLDKILFSELARFGQLRSLDMRLHEIKDRISTSKEYSMSFPLLEDLGLIGDIQHLRQLKFKCPNLTQLALRIGPLSWSDDANPEAPSLPGFLRSFILQFTSVEHICMPLQAKGVVADLLKELSKKGDLPRNWKTISFLCYAGSRPPESTSIEMICGNVGFDVCYRAVF